MLSRLFEERLALTPDPRPLTLRLTVQEFRVLQGEEGAAGAFRTGEEEGMGRLGARSKDAELPQDVLVTDDAGHGRRVQGMGNGRQEKAGAAPAGV